MEKRRKEILLRLKNILDNLNEEQKRRKPSSLCSCKKCSTSPTRRNDIAFGSTTGRKEFNLVPFRDKKTTSQHSGSDQCCGRKRYDKKKTVSCEFDFPSIKPKMQRSRSQYCSSTPSRFLESRELRGSISYVGCDCCKANGLQDKCRRFCCIGNPKCKEHPPACYLSRFCNGRHLPDSNHRKPKPTYSDFNKESHEIFDYIDAELDSIDIIQQGEESCRLCCPVNHHLTFYDSTNCEKPSLSRTRCRSCSRSYNLKNDCVDLQGCPSYSERMKRSPRYLLETQSNHFCFIQPSKICVVYPLNQVEEPYECCPVFC